MSAPSRRSPPKQMTDLYPAMRSPSLKSVTKGAVSPGPTTGSQGQSREAVARGRARKLAIFIETCRSLGAAYRETAVGTSRESRKIYFRKRAAIFRKPVQRRHGGRPTPPGSPFPNYGFRLPTASERLPAAPDPCLRWWGSFVVRSQNWGTSLPAHPTFRESFRHRHIRNQSARPANRLVCRSPSLV